MLILSNVLFIISPNFGAFIIMMEADIIDELI